MLATAISPRVRNCELDVLASRPSMEQTAPGADWWNAVSAAAAAASALSAAVQIHLSRRDAKRQSAFASLRELEQRLAAVLPIGIQQVHQEVENYYRGKIETLSTDAGAFLAFMNNLEMLSLGRLRGAMDERITDDYVRTVFNSPVVNPDLLTALQTIHNDRNLFEHVLEYRRRLQRQSAFQTLVNSFRSEHL